MSRVTLSSALLPTTRACLVITLVPSCDELPLGLGFTTSCRLATPAGRIEFTCVADRTISPPAALHPASRRRSCSWFQTQGLGPAGNFAPHVARLCRRTSDSHRRGAGDGYGISRGAGRHDQAFFDDIRRNLADKGCWQGEVWNRRKSGDAYVQWMSITRASLPDEAGAYVATLTDITLRKEVEERMQYRADHDALTGMPNRGLFQDRLAAALMTSHRNRQPFAVLFVDLDRFKLVNDRLGHPAGDALLIEAGARIAACARESDTVARFGGDEFALILTEVGGFAEAEEVAQRICVALAEPFTLPQGEAQVAGSVGIAVSPAHGSDAASLEANADEALYIAKRGGGNRWCVYSPGAKA